MAEKIVQIKEGEQYITLNVLLKLSGIISTGGQAKFFLQDHKAIVNNEEESRRGRKLYPGDKVIIEKETFIIQ